MKRYAAYLFDGDGTLYDTAEMIYKCFLYTCKEFGGITVNRRDVFANIGIPLQPQLEHFLGPLSDQQAEKVTRAHMEYQMTLYKDCVKLFPAVASTLEYLKKRGSRLAVVTSRKHFTLKLYLEHTGIYQLFDILISPEDTLRHKPDPEPAEEALRRLGCQAHETLFIGDSEFDIACGAHAGTDTAFVAWSTIPSSQLPIQPTYIISTMEELI